MIRPLLLPLLALGLAAPAASAQRAGPYLVSLDGVRLAAGERVAALAIDTWGVDILAVCRLPAGWQLKAGRNATPDGRIEGMASHGVAALERLSALDGLALVRLDGPVRAIAAPVEGGAVPATFAGRLTLRDLAAGREREAALTPTNIRLAPATRCPAPRRAERRA